MHIQEFLSSSVSRANIDYAAHWTIENPENFNELYQLIFSKNPNIAWRAAWVAEKAQLLKPELLIEKLPEIITALPYFQHDGSKRILLLIILRSPLPNPIPVELINTCFDWLMSKQTSVGIQVNCMKILANICLQEPDLRHELELFLNNDLSEYSYGFRTSARKILNHDLQD